MLNCRITSYVSMNEACYSITQSKFICHNNIVKYIQSNNKQRHATRKAKWLNELAAEYNLLVAIIYNIQYCIAQFSLNKH